MLLNATRPFKSTALPHNSKSSPVKATKVFECNDVIVNGCQTEVKDTSTSFLSNDDKVVKETGRVQSTQKFRSLSAASKPGKIRRRLSINPSWKAVSILMLFLDLSVSVHVTSLVRITSHTQGYSLSFPSNLNFKVIQPLTG